MVVYCVGCVMERFQAQVANVSILGILHDLKTLRNNEQGK